jgi:hypothetical protein
MLDTYGFGLTKKETWLLINVIFASIFSLAVEHGKISVYGLLSVTVRKINLSGNLRMKIVASTPVNRAINLEEKPNFYAMFLDKGQEHYDEEVEETVE